MVLNMNPSSILVKRVHFALETLSQPEDKQGSTYDHARSHRKTSDLRGKECLKVKLSRIKADIDKELSTVKDNFESGKSSSEWSLQQLYKKLEDLDRKLELDSPFENVLKKLYLKSYIDQEEFHKHEEWLKTNKSLVETLMNAIFDALEKKRNEKVSEIEQRQEIKSNFATFFKKQDPPRFKGDCIDFLEF